METAPFCDNIEFYMSQVKLRLCDTYIIYVIVYCFYI
jgi:hypothetical protein